MVTTHNAKGMTNMNIHPDFKSKKILGFIADLIIDYDYDDYDQLSDCDKSQLTAFLCEANGAYDETDTAQSIELFKKTLCGEMSEQDFFEALKENAMSYYDYTMKSLFNYVHDDYQRSRREWLDYVVEHGDADKAHDLYRDGLIG